MRITQRPIEKLVPYAQNARTHSEAQVAQLAASIEEFGWTNPVLVDGDNGIIAGHGRVMAALKLGQTKVPCIEIAHLTEEQRRAYIIADNRLAENAGWDDELLALELGDLVPADYDIGVIGFSEEDLDHLLFRGIEPLDGMPVLSSGPRSPFRQMTFTLHESQIRQVLDALTAAKQLPPPAETVNENSNGNALAQVCAAFLISTAMT